jgi:hypothetical protein
MNSNSVIGLAVFYVARVSEREHANYIGRSGPGPLKDLLSIAALTIADKKDMEVLMVISNGKSGGDFSLQTMRLLWCLLRQG